MQSVTSGQLKCKIKLHMSLKQINTLHAQFSSLTYLQKLLGIVYCFSLTVTVLDRHYELKIYPALSGNL